ncbi:RNA-binding protein [Schizosaccharomyces japonicus yFS275]|uniref:RNA-binding protein n=1 Tax=Schizosaccharomyces japonicus (strain yFS275 / FY16936) TaxID=402676 RepID=B6JVI1_SCHJY|nr:RNA-binding protein [Schizosaccharomyces japonicus yFS275]EEB05382.2 RNA-binding protein [Schizosaccharomyces japonicus yFS275]
MYTSALNLTLPGDGGKNAVSTARPSNNSCALSVDGAYSGNLTAVSHASSSTTNLPLKTSAPVERREDDDCAHLSSANDFGMGSLLYSASKSFSGKPSYTSFIVDSALGSSINTTGAASGTLSQMGLTPSSLSEEMQLKQSQQLNPVLKSPSRRARSGTLPSRLSRASAQLASSTGAFLNAATSSLTGSKKTATLSEYGDVSLPSLEGSALSLSSNPPLAPVSIKVTDELSGSTAFPLRRDTNASNNFSSKLGNDLFSTWMSSSQSSTQARMESPELPVFHRTSDMERSFPQSSLPSSQLASALLNSSMSSNEAEHVNTLDYLGLSDSIDCSRQTTRYVEKFEPKNLKQVSSMNSLSSTSKSALKDDGSSNTAVPYSSHGSLRSSDTQMLSNAFGSMHLSSMFKSGTSLGSSSQLNSLSSSRFPPTSLLSSSHLSDSFFGKQDRSLMSDTQEDLSDNFGLGSCVSKTLMISNLPQNCSMVQLHPLLKDYQTVESIRMLPKENAAIVGFDSPASAIAAHESLQNISVFEGSMPLQVTFVSSMSSSESTMSNSLSSSKESGMLMGSGTLSVSGLGKHAEYLDCIVKFGHSINLDKVEQMLSDFEKFTYFATDIKSPLESLRSRQFDAFKLREIRKNIDNGVYTQEEIEEIAKGMLDDMAELSSDYLGNTVVQKFFEYCSDSVKESMLERIAPHLAEIGTHKNGTWAAQKIIDVASTNRQMDLIIQHLTPYLPLLFLDQFGNYVAQCCLRFGSPKNDFLFQVMALQCCEIGQMRFGARAMRACLENEKATLEQQALLAAAIILNAPRLANNPNGMLLLTWLLDSCVFANRHQLLVLQILPHLATLCTHKVGSTLILKLLNSKQEIYARDLILEKLFFAEDTITLLKVFSDQAVGAGLLYKIITGPYIEREAMLQIHSKLGHLLLKYATHNSQNYRRLMEEVGLISKNHSILNGGMNPMLMDSTASSNTVRDYSFSRVSSQCMPGPRNVDVGYNMPQMLHGYGNIVSSSAMPVYSAASGFNDAYGLENALSAESTASLLKIGSQKPLSHFRKEAFSNVSMNAGFEHSRGRLGVANLNDSYMQASTVNLKNLHSGLNH